MSRLAGYFGGLAAEEVVERRYVAESGRVLARRWRCEAGEIDLVVEVGGVVVFVEVKARKSLGAAAHALGKRQLARVAAAAEVFMSQEGRLGGDMRIDLALVDAAGAVEIVENVSFGSDGYGA